MTKNNPILITTALPYANGPIHLGHLVEYIQADIWVRAQKMDKREISFVCADDAHGTAIMLKAQADGITAQELIDRVQKEHLQDFTEFGVAFDNYHSTHSPENEFFASYIYLQLKKIGLIEVRNVEQCFDNVKNIFLPDRFIKGTCPKCKSSDQYGDSCEICGAAYSPQELINPYSTISKSTPILKNSEHYFFKLSDIKCKEFLREWTRAGHLQEEASNKVSEWLHDSSEKKDGEKTLGLSDWDISRDAPYFGFKIPETIDKYFYVWLDAPIGYIASYANYLIRKNKINITSPEQYNEVVADVMSILAGDNTELYHFIGKDILYFHALFWPAMLKFAGFRTPTALYVHGFLTINGQKMSKSRGTFITAREYLNCGINPEFLRYYFASRINPKIEDLDLNLEEFEQKTNSDLVGKTVNIASRASPFIQNIFAGKLINQNIDEVFYQLLPEFKTLISEVRECYINREFSKAIRLIMQAADCANKYCDEQKPWQIAKEIINNEQKKEELHLICSMLINAFRLITICLKPVLPNFIINVQRFLNINELFWDDGKSLLPAGFNINPYFHLLKRLDKKEISQLINNQQQAQKMNEKSTIPKITNITNAVNNQTISAHTPTTAISPKIDNGLISIDDVIKLDLRIAQVETAEVVAETDKMVKLGINLGKKADGSEDKRTIFAGIKQHYSPEKLIGKKVVVVANLAPRKMRFGTSEGMLLAASFPGDSGGVFVIEPEGGEQSGAQVGMKVK